MTGSDVWLDFEQVRHTIKNNTVDKLKQILSGFNEECATHVSKTGKKQEVIDRIVGILDHWRAQNMEDKWTKAKAVISQVRNTGFYTPNRMNINLPIPPPTNTTALHGQYPIPGLIKNPYANAPGPSTLSRYDPYAPPRKPTMPSNPIPSSSVAKPLGIRFKESPFFQIDQTVSSIVECPESTNATDRRQQHVSFTLNNDQLTKLKSNSKYQIRLFCTSSIFYAGQNSFRANAVPCLIEFPPTCEVRVNNVQLSANLKGLKKKPGTAPPPDIKSYVRLSGVQNRVEMVYVNSQQPPQLKKYYLVVLLVEATTVDSLVSNLKSNSRRSCEEIRQSMVASLSDDDDIVAGPQKMSLKCPLSFLRVATPCRSSRCVHPQCFDATSWFSVMEQTTTWLCPVCERVLDCKDLIIDGYFDEILKACPESVEDVMVEANGDWHTSDNKHASAGWRVSHPTVVSDKISSLPQPRAHSPPRPTTADSNGKAKANDSEVLVLDSDDEDEGQVKRELSPSFASGSSVARSSVPQSQPARDDAIIDLTLDSDEDEESPPKQTGKRKATESDISQSASSTDQMWKKSRVDSGSFGTSLTNGDGHNTTSSLRPPISPLRYPSGGYSPAPMSPVYSRPRGGTPSGNPRLPSINNMLPPASGRWA